MILGTYKKAPARQNKKCNGISNRRVAAISAAKENIRRIYGWA